MSFDGSTWDRRGSRSRRPWSSTAPRQCRSRGSSATSSIARLLEQLADRDIEDQPAEDRGGRCRGGKRRQAAVPRQHEPRAPDAAQRHRRLCAAASRGRGGGGAQRVDGRSRPHHPRGAAPRRTDQRHPRYLQDRSGTHRARVQRRRHRRARQRDDGGARTFASRRMWRSRSMCRKMPGGFRATRPSFGSAC